MKDKQEVVKLVFEKSDGGYYIYFLEKAGSKKCFISDELYEDAEALKIFLYGVRKPYKDRNIRFEYCINR